MPDFVPVDHQPEFDAEQFVPPFLADWTKQAAGKDVETVKNVKDSLAALATLPQRALEASAQDVQHLGETDYQPQSVGPSIETALTMMGGGLAGVEGGGAAVGAGPMRMIENADLYKEMANLNRAKGWATGKSAEGWNFKRPDPAKGSFQQAAQEARAKLGSDFDQAQREYSQVAPGNPNMSPEDWAFIDENIKRGNPTLGSGATDKKTAATIQAIRGTLDMSQDARLGRASEQGFDTSNPLYHGTSKDVDFKKFKDSRHGTWTTTDPAEASAYAKDNDSKNFDLRTNQPINSADRVLPLYGKSLQNPYTGPVPDSVRTATNYKKAQSDWFDQLKQQGYDGVQSPGSGVRVDFNNANLRSQLAPFDPKNAGKSVIFGSGAPDEKTAAMIQAIRAYHGSPHDFDRFDLSKIGTGEGAQAYGHGLYFAENPEVAESYRNALMGQGADMNNPEHVASMYLQGMSDRPTAIEALRDNANKFSHGDASSPEILNRAADILESGTTPKKPGSMYEVNINADPDHFIDWDKPLSEQSQFVKDAIAKHDSSLSTQPPSITQIKDPEIRSIVRRALKVNDGQAQGLEMTIDNDSGLYKGAVDHAKRNGVDLDEQDMRASDYVYKQAKPYIDALHASQNLTGDSLGNVLGVKGADMMQAGPAAARLRDAGIKGIKYLDEGSRGPSTIYDVGSPQKDFGPYSPFTTRGEAEKHLYMLKRQGFSDAEIKEQAQPQSRNYAVFDDKLIDIIRKYGIAGLPAAGVGAGAMQSQPSNADMVNAIRGQGG